MIDEQLTDEFGIKVDTSKRISEEQRRKQSIAMKGRKYSEEHKAKIGASVKKQIDRQKAKRRANFVRKIEQQTIEWLANHK